MMETALQEQYEYFDKDKSGTMELDELLHWMTSVHHDTGSPTIQPNVEIAGYVIQFLDEDVSGTLEQREWLDWLREGHLTMLDEKRKRQYTSEGGDGAKCIVDFLAMVVLQASKRTGEMVESMAAEYEERLVKEQSEAGAAAATAEEEEEEEEGGTLGKKKSKALSKSKRVEIKVADQGDEGPLAPSNQQHGEFSSFAGEKANASPSLFRSSPSSEGKNSDGNKRRHRHRHRRHHHHHHHSHRNENKNDDNSDDDEDDDGNEDDYDEDEETHI